MAGETPVTLVGNLTADPELRFTPSGQPVASFTVASTPRRFDQRTQEWRDGDALFLRVDVWKQQAENVAEGLRRGDRVVITGSLHQRSYEDREGRKRTVLEVTAEEVAASCRWATVSAQRAQRGSRQPAGSGPAADPWGVDPSDF